MRKLAYILMISFCSMGCVSWRQGTVTPQEVPSEFQAQAPRKLKTLELASLGTAEHSEHRIHAGDLLEVTISDLVGQGQFYPLPVRVLEDGMVRLPLAGSVTVAGLSFPEAEQLIFATYSSQGLLKKPLIAPATFETSWNATSPTSRVLPSAPGSRLMPTSITVAPGLIQSPRTISGLPTAA